MGSAMENFQDIKCSWCSQQHYRKIELLNNFAVVCSIKKGKHFDKVVNVISEECDVNTDYYCHSITSCMNSVLSWHPKLVLENCIKCNFKLVTGYDVNLFPISVFENVQCKC
ncbi:hypothetical protein PR048_013489 [Dryococelus australis]|uniref:Uncharacterized protein n=1 Tax=Dryococelus australis TaxID=614101 RepID=A0ABQ9HT56_9NEOP|nr:hypothetical protein PR048_013489 [Dryococelus australis]